MSYYFSLQAHFQIAKKELLLATKLSSVLRMSMSVMAGFIVRSMDPMLKMRILTSANPGRGKLSLKEQTMNVLKHTVLIESELVPPSVIHM